MKKQLFAMSIAIGTLLAVLRHISAADRPAIDQASKSGVLPAEGYVPDAKTAIKIAEAVIEPVYGAEIIKDERPFKARLTGGEWVVKGSGPTNAEWVGGVAEVHISKTNGCITFLFHWK